MSSASHSPQYLAESRTAVLNAFYAIPIPLEILSTSLRLWSVRTRETDAKRLSFDDYLMIWATVSMHRHHIVKHGLSGFSPMIDIADNFQTISIAVCVSGLVYGAPYGLGRHVEAVSAQDLQTFMLVRESLTSIQNRVFVLMRKRATTYSAISMMLPSSAQSSRSSLCTTVSL